jgi:hypothetical protein
MRETTAPVAAEQKYKEEEAKELASQQAVAENERLRLEREQVQQIVKEKQKVQERQIEEFRCADEDAARKRAEGLCGILFLAKQEMSTK